MKICSICKNEKDDADFNWRNKSKGMRQGYCRECKKICQKRYYSKSKLQYLNTIYKSRAKRKQANIDLVVQHFKSHACVDCGENDIRILEFDHVRGVKRANVSHLMAHGYSLEVLINEIAKCEVRCAKCHMIKTCPNRFNLMVVNNEKSTLDT